MTIETSRDKIRLQLDLDCHERRPWAADISPKKPSTVLWSDPVGFPIPRAEPTMSALPPGTCRDAFRHCYLIAGTWNASLVLERLSRTKGKAAKIPASNDGWRPLPREQLMRECLLSRSQCDRALAALKARNLIETSQHWHQPAGAYVMHVRMLSDLPTEK